MCVCNSHPCIPPHGECCGKGLGKGWTALVKPLHVIISPLLVLFVYSTAVPRGPSQDRGPVVLGALQTKSTDRSLPRSAQSDQRAVSRSGNVLYYLHGPYMLH